MPCVPELVGLGVHVEVGRWASRFANRALSEEQKCAVHGADDVVRVVHDSPFEVKISPVAEHALTD